MRFELEQCFLFKNTYFQFTNKSFQEMGDKYHHPKF